MRSRGSMHGDPVSQNGCAERGDGVESGGSPGTSTAFRRFSSRLLRERALLAYSTVTGLASFGVGSLVNSLSGEIFPSALSVSLAVLAAAVCMVVAAAFAETALHRLGRQRGL